MLFSTNGFVNIFVLPETLNTGREDVFNLEIVLFAKRGMVKVLFVRKDNLISVSLALTSDDINILSK